MLFRLGKSQPLAFLLVILAITVTACRTNALKTVKEQSSNLLVQNKLKLQIKETGVYRVTQQDLADAGMDVSELSADNLRLSEGGTTIPYLIKDNSLIFFAGAPDSRYVSERSYMLEVGESGSEIPVTSASASDLASISKVLQTVHLEKNLEYTSEARQEDLDDVWFWYKLRQQDVFTVEVDLSPNETEPASIRISAWGFTYDRAIEGDHSFDVLINDNPVGNVIWDGQTSNISELEIPLGLLHAGTNRITIDNRPEGATFLDIMQINWIELDYFAPAKAVDDRLTFPAQKGLTQLEGFSDEPIILDISTSLSPKLLNDWRYENGQVLLPLNKEVNVTVIGPNGFLTPRIEQLRISEWHNDKLQADLIIITTEELAPSMSPLIKAREEQGLSVALVPVEEIYDEFGYGDASPESIRQFVAYAYENWQEPAPRYLFIVGDATTDPLGNLGDVPSNIVPSMIVPVQFSGETVSDSRLADIDEDMKPELAVGRWPVRTVKEVENLVNRTIAYERGQASKRVLFAADGSEPRFSSTASLLSDSSGLPEEYVELLQSPSAEEITAKLNEGSWLTTYVGHGSISRWGKEGIFELDAVNDLVTESPPIILQLTCLTGLFSHPQEISLAEAMLNHPHGPVLTVAATSLTLSGHQEPFAKELLQRLQDPNIVRIGDAFQGAKLALDIESSTGLREVSDTFALFGDPSTIIVRP